jgi:hypothetical protein
LAAEELRRNPEFQKLIHDLNATDDTFIANARFMKPGGF